MRIYFILTAVLCIFCLTAPLITFTINANPGKDEGAQSLTETSAAEKTTAEKISVLNLTSAEATQTDMTEYIIGVVAGEMPASFSPEALKAQAVAAYTYAQYVRENGADSITDSPALHQSYIDKDAQKSKWGDDYGLYRQIIEDAVNAVKGERLICNGKTALTVFHAASHNKTNSAEEIWGSAVPYLISVDAPSEETFSNTATFTADEFRSRFEEKGNVEITEKDFKKWASVSKKDDSGHIRSLKVADKDFTAVEVKEILDLPSADFTGKIENDTFVFTTFGKGHGVGMSQYSAEYMAKQGKSYKEIVAHFYPGTAIEKE